MRTLLLVDDDAAIRRIAQLSLERTAGWRVHLASDGEQALELARDHLPELVLLDLMMPGLDGVETLAALRADAATASIPVAFLTAKAIPSEIERLLGLGALGVVTKPFDPLCLAAELEALLEAAARGEA